LTPRTIASSALATTPSPFASRRGLPAKVLRDFGNQLSPNYVRDASLLNALAENYSAKTSLEGKKLCGDDEAHRGTHSEQTKIAMKNSTITQLLFERLSSGMA
jgi:hypothetical protein